MFVEILCMLQKQQEVRQKEEAIRKQKEQVSNECQHMSCCGISHMHVTLHDITVLCSLLRCASYVGYKQCCPDWAGFVVSECHQKAGSAMLSIH